MALKYQRILLKISGEALGGEKGMGFDEPTMDAICGGVKKAHELGVQIGIVVGGGNFWRGRSSGKMERTLADKIGMLATVMNALQDRRVRRRHRQPVLLHGYGNRSARCGSERRCDVQGYYGGWRLR